MRREPPFFPLATVLTGRSGTTSPCASAATGTARCSPWDAGRATATAPTAYSMDASRLETGLDALELRWQGSG